MQRWRILALEPSAMRRPDRFTDEPGITTDGGHIPVTLHHLDSQSPNDDIMSRIASRLSSLVPVQAVRAVSDDVRQLYSLELEERTGVRLRANSISDGTLRFLALTAIAEATDATGVYCMEEPENGIHPEKLAAMNQLLHDIPAECRFETSEVKVIKGGEQVTLRPRGKNWRAFFDRDSRGSLPARQQPPLEERDPLR